MSHLKLITIKRTKVETGSYIPNAQVPCFQVSIFTGPYFKRSCFPKSDISRVQYFNCIFPGSYITTVIYCQGSMFSASHMFIVSYCSIVLCFQGCVFRGSISKGCYAKRVQISQCPIFPGSYISQVFHGLMFPGSIIHIYQSLEQKCEQDYQNLRPKDCFLEHFRSFQ